MSVPQSVADILDHHVTFQLECIDRMYLNVYVPKLQCESGVAKFFRSHRGHLFASSALMDPITKAFVKPRVSRGQSRWRRTTSGREKSSDRSRNSSGTAISEPCQTRPSKSRAASGPAKVALQRAHFEVALKVSLDAVRCCDGP